MKRSVRRRLRLQARQRAWKLARAAAENVSPALARGFRSMPGSTRKPHPAGRRKRPGAPRWSKSL